jgi:hypothetical protein
MRVCGWYRQAASLTPTASFIEGVATMPEATNRAQVLSHEEIVKHFLGSKAVDFNALGKFVASYGESIAISGRGDYGVRIGWYNILACFKIGPQVINQGDFANSGISADVIGR